VISKPAAIAARRPAALLALLALTLGLLAGPLATRAYAEGTASSFAVEADLGFDGVLAVQQTITFSGRAPAELSQKFETRENLVGNRQYVVDLEGFSATAGEAPVTPKVQEDGRFTTVTVPTNGATTVTMTYRVIGAVVPAESGTALRWRLLQGLSADVTTFTATVGIPSSFSYVRCTAGPPNSTVPCASAFGGSEGSQQPTFSDGPRGVGEVVGIEIGFPPGTVPANAEVVEEWTVGRAFSADPLPLALALGLLVLGGLLLLMLHRRAGADAAAGGDLARVAEFAPVGEGQSEFRVVDDIRPGHVGTVADERVDPIDITATLLDLAVRGHLLITELPRTHEFAPTEWELSRQSASANDLRPFERALLDGIASSGPVRVSELPGRVSEVIADVQDKLYDEVVQHGWYERRPDATRSSWTQWALIALVGAVVATALLAAFTSFGLVGLALLALALGLAFVGQEMPARTRRGSALLGGLGALRSDLLSHPTNQMPRGRELSELSEVLPYAVVLGGSDRWLDAIVDADTDPAADSRDLPWYHGPETWHLRDLPDSLRNFVRTVSGTLFAR
jgi:hypothetical protein